ncbi:hypothetical protein Pint_04270 [Pistacia integerrima]|uniref:Uncharacterized protein n=1 Tax=Pistacia integerrima TaxID=434235 RepID=A0ACC0Z0V1_9ROSI|nr:hypothetical protein Pint_04270 [Pistacia integerrima]
MQSNSLIHARQIFILAYGGIISFHIYAGDPKRLVCLIILKLWLMKSEIKWIRLKVTVSAEMTMMVTYILSLLKYLNYMYLKNIKLLF